MPALPLTPAAALKARINKLLQTPAVEMTLMGLILLSVVLIFLEIGASPARGGYQRRLHLQGALTAIFWLELAARGWAANDQLVVIARKMPTVIED